MAAVDIEKICYGCMGDLDAPGIVCPKCGWDNTQRKDQWGRLPAMTLKDGRFFIGRPLGSGGFGVTYLGRDLLAGEFEDARRAVKEFFPMGLGKGMLLIIRLALLLSRLLQLLQCQLTNQPV